jgi:DNA-binding transcriptional regulator YdaS (Cro superfamily)
MAQEVPGQTPEGRLIEEAARATGRSIRALAANAGMSDTRWRQVIRGHQQGSTGRTIEARASATALARMAIAVDVDPEQLADVGRPDAAEEQRRILESPRGAGVPSYHPVGPDSSEIELINASTTMTTREKLQAIQIVLRLRAELEAETRAQHSEAPARDAGAEMNGTS